MTQHTKGPLALGEVRYIGYRPDVEACAYLIRPADGMPPLPLARLIAAAPDLLEALRFVLLRFPCLEDKHLPYLRGIVAKATEEVQK